MANDPKHPGPDKGVDEDMDEPSEEEIERQRRSSPTWKHPDDGKELSDRDREFPLKP
jgi:hypothetical protein